MRADDGQHISQERAMKYTGLTVVCGLCLAGLAMAGNLNPPAAPTAGTMKPLDQIEPRTAVQSLLGSDSAVYVISQPGSYYLTCGITVTEAKHAISIVASNVSLDLCGFTITGAYESTDQNENPSYDGIRIQSGLRNIVIRNGIIEGQRTTRKFGLPPRIITFYTLPFSRGIAADWDLSVTPRVQSQGIIVENITTQGNRGYGICLKGRDHLVNRCNVAQNEGPGIHAGYPSTVKDNHQSDNGDNMLTVPSGAFPYQNTADMADWVFLPVFAVARYETTNREYAEFLNEYDPRGEYWDSNMEILRSGSSGQYGYSVVSGKDAYPIRAASCYDAMAMAVWKSRVTGLSFRLPTEQEWEKAAGWDPVEKKLYTCGFHRDAIDSTWCNYNGAYGGPLPVGSFNGTGGKNDAKSYYGCYDMSGNVWEWTSSLFETTSNNRVLRGGYWSNVATYCAVTYRSNYSPAYRYSSIGFRLVLDLN
jgi:formylglycine-generating enzyme required for sulfatase activity